MRVAETYADLEAAAVGIVEAGAARGVPLRVLGGIAVRLHAPAATRPPFARTYRDIDLAAPARATAKVEAALAALGYQGDREFNLLNGATRLLFAAPDAAYTVDVFVGDFTMCHRVPLDGRLEQDPLTLPLAELLLTKLQIVQLNAKDLSDILALLVDHPLGAGDREMINQQRIADLCARDWGLWKTVDLSLDRAAAAVATLNLDATTAGMLRQRIAELRSVLERAPKTLAWKARAAVGERRRWYVLPEEVERGAE